MVRWKSRGSLVLLALALALSLSGFVGASGGASPGPGVVGVSFGHNNVDRSVLALEPDGTIVAVASVYMTPHAHSFALVRVDRRGRTLGSMTWPFSSPLSFPYPYAVAVAPDGGIVVAGTADAYISLVGGFLVRFHPDGSVDTSFGTEGIVLQPPTATPGTGFLTDALIQPDGKIVTAGLISSGPGATAYCLERYDAHGVLDPTFGSDGLAACGSGGAIALQSDGKIVAAGATLLARYNTDGSLDRSFGSDGTVSHRVVHVTDVAVQPNGRIVVAGDRLPGAYVLRYLPDGSPDASFGDSGQTAAGAASVWRQIAVQPDGKIDAVGWGEGSYGVLARYGVDGSLDRSFGRSGLTKSAGVEDSLALQPDGKIVVGGSDILRAGQPRSLTIARYLAGGRADTTFGAGCVVPRVVGLTLRRAKRAIAKAGCRIGSISSKYATARKGRIVAQSPKAGTRLPAKGRVNLVRSRGPRHAGHR